MTEPKWTPEDDAQRPFTDAEAAAELHIDQLVLLYFLEDMRRDSEYMYYDSDMLNWTGVDHIAELIDSGEARETLIDKLADLRRARQQWHEARLRMNHLVHVAYKFGIPAAEIADTLGITRHGVYRILNMGGTK